MKKQRFIQLVVIFILIFSLLPLTRRSISINSPDCSKIDCSLINIKQDIHAANYPGLVTLIKQAQDTRSSGESFWHDSYDPEDSGIYLSEVARNIAISILTTALLVFFVIPNFKKYKKWF